MPKWCPADGVTGSVLFEYQMSAGGGLGGAAGSAGFGIVSALVARARLSAALAAHQRE